MDTFKIALAVTWGFLLLAALGCFAAARFVENPTLKRAGTLMLGIWLVYDLLIIVLAFTFGWIK